MKALQEEAPLKPIVEAKQITMEEHVKRESKETIIPVTPTSKVTTNGITVAKTYGWTQEMEGGASMNCLIARILKQSIGDYGGMAKHTKANRTMTDRERMAISHFDGNYADNDDLQVLIHMAEEMGAIVRVVD